MKPLDGVVILDLSRFLAGPYCTLLLAGLGAEVIRVEPPGGEAYRERPPFGGPKGAGMERRTVDDVAIPVLHRSRGKKSITLNPRTPAGSDLLRKLCATVDVIVENFLPGTMDKMGLGFPALQAANPRVILCSISGFGQHGPLRDWRAYDPIVQAMSGMSSVTGYPDRPPVRSGAALADTTASMFGVIGVLSALRARDRTGRGDWVDVAMLDASFFMLADVLEFAAAGVPLGRLGNGHQGTVPFNVYRARDGWVTLAAVTAREWADVLRALGRSDLASDPRFDGGITSRRDHREEIDALVQGWIGQRTMADAVEILQAHHVAAGPVQDLADASDDEHLRAREMVVPLAHPSHGPVPGAWGAGMPLKFANHPTTFDAPAPAPGAHNEEIYGRLGLGKADLDALRAEGVI